MRPRVQPTQLPRKNPRPQLGADRSRGTVPYEYAPPRTGPSPAEAAYEQQRRDITQQPQERTIRPQWDYQQPPVPRVETIVQPSLGDERAGYQAVARPQPEVFQDVGQELQPAPVAHDPRYRPTLSSITTPVPVVTMADALGLAPDTVESGKTARSPTAVITTQLPADGPSDRRADERVEIPNLHKTSTARRKTLNIHNPLPRGPPPELVVAPEIVASPSASNRPLTVEPVASIPAYQPSQYEVINERYSTNQGSQFQQQWTPTINIDPTEPVIHERPQAYPRSRIAVPTNPAQYYQQQEVVMPQHLTARRAAQSAVAPTLGVSSANYDIPPVLAGATLNRPARSAQLVRTSQQPGLTTTDVDIEFEHISQPTNRQSLPSRPNYYIDQPEDQYPDPIPIARPATIRTLAAPRLAIAAQDEQSPLAITPLRPLRPVHHSNTQALPTTNPALELGPITRNQGASARLLQQIWQPLVSQFVQSAETVTPALNSISDRKKLDLPIVLPVNEPQEHSPTLPFNTTTIRPLQPVPQKTIAIELTQQAPATPLATPRGRQPLLVKSSLATDPKKGPDRNTKIKLIARRGVS